MNYFGPQQREDGRWEYGMNGYPWGYCTVYRPFAGDEPGIPKDLAERENAKMAPLVGNFHTDGHATREEACECYKRFLLDTQLRLQPEEPADANQQHRCQVCNKFTACYAMVGPYRLFTLCPEHQTRWYLAPLLTVGESWES